MRSFLKLDIQSLRNRLELPTFYKGPIGSCLGASWGLLFWWLMYVVVQPGMWCHFTVIVLDHHLYASEGRERAKWSAQQKCVPWCVNVGFCSGAPYELQNSACLLYWGELQRNPVFRISHFVRYKFSSFTTLQLILLLENLVQFIRLSTPHNKVLGMAVHKIS